MLVMFILSAGAMNLQFDNSEDGFFPDDPSVDLLNEIETEYRANIDFIRIIDEIDEGDLLKVVIVATTLVSTMPIILILRE